MALVSTGTITIVDFNDVTIASSAPATPVLNQLWFDTSITPSALKRWDGTKWVSSNLTPQEYQSILNTVTNYNNSNDRDGSFIPPPSRPTDAVTSTQNTDSSVDLALKWDWTGNSQDIDGWLINIYKHDDAVGAQTGITSIANDFFS